MHKKYVLSFTASSLSFHESITIAEVYLNCKNWDETEKTIKGKNLLQSSKTSRTRRTYQELSKRLQILSDNQIDVLVKGDSEKQKQILWLAICLRYSFIYEFAIEVIREKFLAMDYQIENFDYESFFNKKADWHDELEEITELTKNKLRQVLFLMMKLT